MGSSSSKLDLPGDIQFETVLLGLGAGQNDARRKVYEHCFFRVSEALQRSFGTSRVDVHDAVHSAFSTFFRKPVAQRQAVEGAEARLIRDWGQLTGLLVRIAQNKCLRRYKEYGKNVGLGSGSDTRSSAPRVEPVARGETPAEEAAAREVEQELRLAESLQVEVLKREIGRAAESAELATQQLHAELGEQNRLILEGKLNALTYKEIADYLAEHGQTLSADAVQKRWQRAILPVLMRSAAENFTQLGEDSEATPAPAADALRTLTDPRQLSSMEDNAALAMIEEHLRAEAREAIIAAMQHLVATMTSVEWTILRGKLDGLSTDDIKQQLKAQGIVRNSDRIEELWPKVWRKVEETLAKGE